MREAVSAALVAGYRHLDCAELYASTAAVGEAISASSVPRSELWITSKLKGMPSGEFEDVVTRAKAHASQLQCGSFDLLLMHWPGRDTADFSGSVDAFTDACSWAYFEANVGPAWDNMQRLVEAGVARRIGVSNFNASHLAELKRQRPAAQVFANEIYVDPVHQQATTVDACRAAGVEVLAYRPLAFVGVYAMAAGMGDGTHAALSAAVEKAGAPSAHAAVLGWLRARGVVPLAKSTKPEHIAANLAASSGEATWSVGANAFDSIPEVAGMIDMLGGCDEYAVAMMAIANRPRLTRRSHQRMLVLTSSVNMLVLTSSIAPAALEASTAHKRHATFLQAAQVFFRLGHTASVFCRHDRQGDSTLQCLTCLGLLAHFRQRTAEPIHVHNPLVLSGGDEEPQDHVQPCKHTAAATHKQL